jgi:hypothetical protein
MRKTLHPPGAGIGCRWRRGGRRQKSSSCLATQARRRSDVTNRKSALQKLHFKIPFLANLSPLFFTHGEAVSGVAGITTTVACIHAGRVPIATSEDCRAESQWGRR